MQSKVGTSKLVLPPKPLLSSYQPRVQGMLTNRRESERSLAQEAYAAETTTSPSRARRQVKLQLYKKDFNSWLQYWDVLSSAH